MSKRKTKLDHVELLNVPCYRQGTFDSLCAYYTGAMMLSALFPQYGTQFGEAARQRTTKNVSDDPLVKHHPNNKDDRLALARWFYMGEWIETVTKILNNIMEADGINTTFECQKKGAHPSTFSKTIAGSIDLGLPVMLGWATEDYGDHAALVTGYWEGAEKWLILNDPGGMTEISWDSLKSQKKGKLDIGLCKPSTFHGARPMKWTSSRGVLQWTPKLGRPGESEYMELDRLFSAESS